VINPTAGKRELTEEGCTLEASISGFASRNCLFEDDRHVTVPELEGPYWPLE
jgi:hypothetical protein